MPPLSLEDMLELSQVPKMIQTLLRILLIGIATHSLEEVNILNTILLNMLKTHAITTIELKLRTETLSTAMSGLPMQLIVSQAQIKLQKLMYQLETQMKLIQTVSMMELTFKEELDTTKKIPMIVIQTQSAHTMECTVLNITQRSLRASNKELDTTIKLSINQENSKT